MHQDLRTRREARKKRERDFKAGLELLADAICKATKLTISRIAYVQYLYKTDASRLTKVLVKTPIGKSRIKCIFVIDYPYDKITHWHKAQINNALARQWELVKIEENPDKCGVLISVNPHNVK